MLGFFIAGCAEGDKKTSVTNPNPSVFTPTGSISGVVFDMCKQAPVEGAVVSVAYAGGVHQVTTGATGAFSFTGVPAVEENSGYSEGEYGETSSSWEQDNDTNYVVTCDLTKVTGYGYATVQSVEVVYSDLGEGTLGTANVSGGGTSTKSGSGASTPVNGLAATMEFSVSALTSTISGTVVDITSGRVQTPATISLYFDGRLIAAPDVSTDGTFSFANVPASDGDDYTLVVTKAGYQYATSGSEPVGLKIHEFGDYPPNGCGYILIDCPVPCSGTLAGIEVDIFANPAKDITVPYITSVAAGGQTDIINGDAFTTTNLPALTPSSITNIVFTFDEAMKADRTIETNAVTLASSFSVLVTSSGASGAPSTTLNTYNIIDSYTVVMTSSGVMTITPTLKTAAEFGTAAGYGTGASAIAVIGTVAVPTGTFTVTFAHIAFPGSAQLTDADLVPWFMAPAYIGQVDSNGFFHAAGEAYQDDAILSNAGVLTFTVNGH
jgi:hypothetical protein